MRSRTLLSPSQRFWPRLAGTAWTELGPPQPNRAPVAQGSIPGQTVTVGESLAVNVASAFSDPDGDPLTYSATSSSPEVVTVAVAGSRVTLGGVAVGIATLTVNATDPRGLSAQITVPVTVVFAGGVCGRTPQVRDEIVRVTGAAGCGAVTDTALAAIRSLYLDSLHITTLRKGDFAGLSSLASLDLWYNDLVALPEEVLSGLSSLETLNLAANDLATLPERVFAGLSSLETLNLLGNDLTGLPEGIFAGLSSLDTLYLTYNDLTTPAGEGVCRTLQTRLTELGGQRSDDPAGGGVRRTLQPQVAGFSIATT